MLPWGGLINHIQTSRLPRLRVLPEHPGGRRVSTKRHVHRPPKFPRLTAGRKHTRGRRREGYSKGRRGSLQTWEQLCSV